MMFKLPQKSEKGFSLIEIALVLVVIGVIISAIGIAKETKETADLTKVYKKVVGPCIAAAVRNNKPAAAAHAQGGYSCDVDKKVATITTPDAASATDLKDKVDGNVSALDFTVAIDATDTKLLNITSNL